MICIGIDPGKDGAMAMIYDGGIAVAVFDPQAYIRMLDNVDGEAACCCLERVSAMPGQGVTSTFNFGVNYGIIQGILMDREIPFELVTPRKWKKEFQVTGDKNSSIAVCKRLFPAVSLRRTDRCKKDHDGMAEALLLAEYARRKFVGKESVR